MSDAISSKLNCKLPVIKLQWYYLPDFLEVGIFSQNECANLTIVLNQA